MGRCDDRRALNPKLPHGSSIASKVRRANSCCFTPLDHKLVDGWRHRVTDCQVLVVPLDPARPAHVLIQRNAPELAATFWKLSKNEVADTGQPAPPLHKKVSLRVVSARDIHIEVQVPVFLTVSSGVLEDYDSAIERPFDDR